MCSSDLEAGLGEARHLKSREIIDCLSAYFKFNKGVVVVIYRVYTRQNLADTSRDPDEIIIDDLGYFDNIDKAILFAQGHIKEHFFSSKIHTPTLDKNAEKGHAYTAYEFCSYGRFLHIDKTMVN